MTFRYPQFFHKTNKNLNLTTMIPLVDLFLFLFGQIWRHQKNIWKLTDLNWFRHEIPQLKLLWCGPRQMTQKNVSIGSCKLVWLIHHSKNFNSTFTCRVSGCFWQISKLINLKFIKGHKNLQTFLNSVSNFR